MSQDGYLYFSSDGKAGFGGLDIYRIPLQQALNGKGNSELIGYPVNGTFDDFGWTQGTDTTKGFFSSDRRRDNDDIYAFRYQPKPKISYITGIVLEKKTRAPMPGATVFTKQRRYDKSRLMKNTLRYQQHGTIPLKR